MASATRSMTHCIFHTTVHPPNGMTELTAVKLITRHLEMETPTKSPGCQTKKGRGIQFNMWRCVKTPAFLPLSPPPSPPVNYHLLSALLPEYLLNIQTYFHPYCNTSVQTTKISHGPQPLSWTSYSQYS